jgi:Carbohydrate esterase, sialic acid-specific acetylesterase
LNGSTLYKENTVKWIVRLLLLVAWFLSIAYVFGVGALIGQFAPQMAERSMQRSAKVMSFFMGEFTPCGDTPALACGYQDVSDRVEVACADYQGEGAAVLMTFGQSNSANAGKDRYIPVGAVANFNFHDGKCYKAEDPLLGPDGGGGSVWGVLSDKLIASGSYDKVLLVPFGIGGSALSQWQEDGDLHPIMKEATAAVKQQGIDPTHVLWHQGESDASSATSEENYFAMFESLRDKLREYGIAAPIYPAVATHCEMTYFETPPEYAQGRENVRAAQIRLPELEGIFPGPDTDSIQGERVRHDNCHFTAKGMQAHADLWMQALVE